ncbi:MAG: hypothetical protein NVS3B14_05830 [Ktedonobacteraceae bacterium]
MIDRLIVQQQRHNWCQTPETHLPGYSAAPAFIQPGFAGRCFPPSSGCAERSAHQKNSTGWDNSLPTPSVSHKHSKWLEERSRLPNFENKLPLSVMHAGLERLAANHQAVLIPLARNSSGYKWCEPVAATTKNEKG